MAISKTCCGLLAVFCSLISFQDVFAQQFSDFHYFIEYPGISQSCIEALNTTVSCPALIASVSTNGAILSSNQLNALCVDSCHSSLLSARGTIEQGCTASTDRVVYNNIAYPATFVIDHYIYTYDVSCKKDSSSGNFCDSLFAAWINETVLTSAQNCSNCFLGVQSVELSSPLGYDANLAANFKSLTSSCGATGYAFTTPTAYGLNGTATNTAAASSTPTSTPNCTASYTVQSGDDCNSIARANNVSTFSLLHENKLNIYCLDFPAPGTSLCLPPHCNVYTVKPGDTCDSIINSTAGITVTQLLAWNPNINSLCRNINGIAGYEICTSPPGGFFDPTAETNLTASIAITAAPAPTNAMTGSNTNCGKWYTVQEGDTCSLVSVYNYIALSDFYFLNPEINSNCTNLDLGEAYCVQAVGSISTYSGYSVNGPTITLSTPLSTSTPTSTSSQPFTGTVATGSALPTASGTIPNCYSYRNYTSDGGTTTNTSISLNDCAYIAYSYNVEISDLEAWNPSLSNSSCSLQPGFSYCVQLTASATAPIVDNGNCQPINQTTPGTISSCECWMNVHGYNGGSYLCQDIADDYSITVTNLTNWNPWVGSNCDLGLYTDLTYYDERAVCIGVNASAPTASATVPPSTVMTATMTSASMGPTQTGIVAGCLQFYTVQSGDSCAVIDSSYNIVFEQFYAWNPAVGDNCQSLWVGYAYCVQGPASSTTTTAGPSAPTQTGITSSCTLYYTVQSGDSCSKIETDYSITFAQLYQWNPAIGSNCESLWIGYAVCVAASS